MVIDYKKIISFVYLRRLKKLMKLVKTGVVGFGSEMEQKEGIPRSEEKDKEHFPSNPG